MAECMRDIGTTGLNMAMVAKGLAELIRAELAEPDTTAETRAALRSLAVRCADDALHADEHFNQVWFMAACGFAQ